MAELTNIRQQATARFLGRLGVIGVGETASDKKALLFLFSDWSALNWRTISRWAKDEGVQVGYEVVGSIQAR